MEIVRQKIASQLGNLRSIQFYHPSAAELHSARPMLGRVQRKENELYRKKVMKQRRDFQLKLQRIDKHLSDLRAEEKRRLDLLKAWEASEGSLPRPTFQPIDVVCPKPVIRIPRMPLRRRVRY